MLAEGDTVHTVVTGAFSYTGQHIARRLLDAGERVVTLTGHPRRDNPFGGAIDVRPLDFNDPARLTENLAGASTLYNTYWVRFPRGHLTFDRAVENTAVLLRAAVLAGVRRIVHISITGASEDSPLGYFRGKGRAEKAVADSGMSYAILRPTVIFGPGDVLVNNIAWFLRRSPLFPVPGDGAYPVQPVHVGDVAGLAVELGRAGGDVVVDSVGPETYTYHSLVRLIGEAVGRRARLLHLPPGLVTLLSAAAGRALGDVVLTGEEVRGLMGGLLASGDAPTGEARFSRWVRESGDTLGRVYRSELARHYR